MPASLLKLPSPLAALNAAAGTAFTSEITPRLFLADWLVAQNWDALESLGITHVISVILIPPIVPRNVKHLHLAISDLPTADISAHFDQTTTFISNALSQANTKVLVSALYMYEHDYFTWPTNLATIV